MTAPAIATPAIALVVDKASNEVTATVKRRAKDAPKVKAPTAPVVQAPREATADELRTMRRLVWSAGTLAHSLVAEVKRLGSTSLATNLRREIVVTRVALYLTFGPGNKVKTPPAAVTPEQFAKADKVVTLPHNKSKSEGKKRTEEQDKAVSAAGTYYSELLYKAGVKTREPRGRQQGATGNGKTTKGANAKASAERTAERKAMPLADKMADYGLRLMALVTEAQAEGMPNDFVKLMASPAKRMDALTAQRREADTK